MPSPPICRRSPRPRRRAIARLCPRLVAFRHECRAEHPDWWNAPVPAFGDRDAWLAIVGLAPGKHGANRTGRPFTGDYAGELLYATLPSSAWPRANIAPIRTTGCGSRARSSSTRSNACRRRTSPMPREIATCRHYLEAALAALPNVRVVIALGQIAHVAAAPALGLPPSSTKFGHGAENVAPDGRILLSSYHCSRYNQNTGRLTPRCSKACSSAGAGMEGAELMARRAGEPASSTSRRRRRVERHDYDRLRCCRTACSPLRSPCWRWMLRLPDDWDGSMHGAVERDGPAVARLSVRLRTGRDLLVHASAAVCAAGAGRPRHHLAQPALLGLIGLTPFVAKMVAEAGPQRALPFYLVALASVFASLTLIRL